jgi:hypothetical protein
MEAAEIEIAPRESSREIEDETRRSRMLSDLDQMRAMLESVLSFLRNGRRLEAMTLADIASTLQLITDQFGDMGRKVAYDGPAHAMATVRPDDLHRAVAAPPAAAWAGGFARDCQSTRTAAARRPR